MKFSEPSQVHGGLVYLLLIWPIWITGFLLLRLWMNRIEEDEEDKEEANEGCNNDSGNAD